MGDGKNIMKKILVKGPILSRSGYGEHARFLVRSLRDYEGTIFDIYMENINWGQTGWEYEDTDERKWIDGILSKTANYRSQGGIFDISAQVTIPNEWERLAPINIGVTAGIETTLISPAWIEKCQLVDKVITISEHSKNTFLNTSFKKTNDLGKVLEEDYRCDVPIDIVHYPVKKHDNVEIDLDLETDFNFLAVAQMGPRKAIVETISWFIEEFEDNENVGLVVKAYQGNNSNLDKVRTKEIIDTVVSAFPERKCKIYLLHGNMVESDLHALYTHPKIKALVSLSHGEGFGLPLFEAAYSGLPVIANEWSGHLDFMCMPIKDKKGKEKIKPMFGTLEYSIAPVAPSVVWPGVIEKEAMWAYSDKNSYKRRLYEMYTDYSRFVGMAKKLKSHVLNNFAEEDKKRSFVEAILGKEQYNKMNVEIEDLPKVSILTSVYDGDEYIRPFLEDITRQTIFESKCELIIVNANSPGSEEEVIKEYVDKYPDNIKYKKLDEDPGIYGTWNIALSMATGEFITNANLDDRKAVNSLELHAINLFQNEDIDLVYADMLITDKPNETFENNSSSGRKYNFPDYSYEALCNFNMPHASPMWRKIIHDNYGTFDEKFRSAGDWEMWLRAASKGSKFKKINDVVGLYYFNPTGISTNPENDSWKREEEEEVFKKYSSLEK
jgi:glycosyltransferase involved in cell wall biosynthesis